MTNANDRNLNITINSPENQKDELIISLSSVIRKLKKYLPIWIITAVVAVVGTFGYTAITTQINKEKLQALVSFSYSGIEKGLDPNGNKFDVNTIKDPAVIENALSNLNLSLTELEPIREGISITGVVPSDAIDRITVYQSILDLNGSSNAAEKILDTSYYPTQYKVSFDYNGTTLSDEDAVDVINEILDYYQTYFYNTYSYNESLGSSVSAIDYTDYDYTEAVDVFNSSLTTLKTYVKQLSNNDNTHFRSATTGFTFDDLYEAVATVDSIDLEKISSYITVNNITKDKEEAMAYYAYRVKTLNRNKAQLEEQIRNYNESIENYVKDQIIVFGDTAEGANTQISQASAQYDKMIGQKNNAVNELATTKQRINYYNEKIEAMKGSKDCTPAQIEKVETQLAKVSKKINTLINNVNDTTSDYFQNVAYKNAYNVLVPASSTTSDRIGRIISNVKMPLVLVEAVIFFLYIVVAFLAAIVTENRKKKAANSQAKQQDAAQESETPKKSKQ